MLFSKKMLAFFMVLEQEDAQCAHPVAEIRQCCYSIVADCTVHNVLVVVVLLLTSFLYFNFFDQFYLQYLALLMCLERESVCAYI